ncbi:N-6 DNA methylase [Oscillibacter sp. MSJ-31]|uniref:N-6 DNA methylase n=1 Tax=Oscillibacter sp. MSJ-31 TaxID=2841526 RepID=UPI001C10A13A|nr:ParM/StbA family protein [Oscillibacter sp. MSJ-31]MBU5457682.1 N-6 DNA methylase [Oscillibacter sp. MSJ-31]
MKYEYYPKRRAEQERRELNEQILRLLQSGACEQSGVTDEDIFNRYTGDGGLHGLRRSDYENYNAFSAAKKELENGQFFTPPPLCEMIVSALRLSDTDLVADLTCGMGNFFNFLPNERNAYGCEVDPNACAVARKLYPQAHIVQGDIRDYERFFILTLFAIAHEIEAMGQYSGSLMRVQLAVGLPPAHFGVQAKRFINYFNGRGAVTFQFKGKPYAIFIENTACFPQSFSAAAATVKNLASFPRALVVDIGGFTADYVRLRNGVPDMAACDSLENGVILLYNRICAKANAELDILLEESEIDRILRGEDQDAAPEVIALAEREAQEFINDLLSGLRERMLELKSGKVIFLGGGATLLRRQIEASGKIGQAIFVEDINANAKGYEYLYRLQHSGR